MDYAISIRTDGRLSIEHQLSIHVNDLLEAAPAQRAQTNALQNSTEFDTKLEQQPRQGLPDILLIEILAGLRYVMDYRIKGGKQPNLDKELMKNLARCLLLHVKHKESGLLLRQRMTKEANIALQLFAEFIEEVQEFRDAVAEIAAVDLRQTLRIYERCKPMASQESKEAAISVLITVSTYLPQQFPDWRDLVSQDHTQVEALYHELSPRLSKQLHAKPPTGQLYPPPALYFDRRVTRVLDMFQVDPAVGLNSNSVLERRSFYGRNDLPAPPKPSILKMLITQITDFMVLILILAAILAGSLGDFKSTVVLMVVVVINVLIGFIQEFKANRALEALLSLNVPKATVLREGNQESLDSSDLVPGDIVVLEEGDAVPADLRLVEVAQLEVIESVLTGESVAVSKKTDPISTRTRKMPLGDCVGNAFMSTVVARGRGKGVVVRTGYKTEIGKISSAISSTPEVKTPLQIRLARLGIYLVTVSVLLCALVVVIGLAWGKEAWAMVSVGVTLAVSVIPEGLVAVVTITLAIGVRRMAARNAIVRKLASVETLGSVTVICSDKTGTLTEGKMNAAEIWTTAGRSYLFANDKNNLKASPTIDPFEGVVVLKESKSAGNMSLSKTAVPKVLQDAPIHLVAASMVSSLCNNSSVVKREADDGTIEWKSTGDPTEIALLVSASKAGFGKDFWDGKSCKKLGEFAFDSDRKMMSVIYEKQSNLDALTKCPVFIMAKGAPESLLSNCTHVVAADAKSLDDCRDIDDKILSDITNSSSSMASAGLRVLGLAIRPLADSNLAHEIIKSAESEQVETNLTFIGLIGLIDPPRDGVKESVAKCKRAGIKVIMITGDHIVTASAIATSLGILDPEHPNDNRAMKGMELDALNDDALHTLRPFPNVFARVSPDNKLRIVNALKKRGQVVAMTGDGVNDAPAIKSADVGVAMGQGGTEITKQAADIVLANDNFATIEAAVEEGRHVFDNIQKFILYLLSCNFAEIFIMLISISIGYEPPFTPIMILYANIIADVPPSLAMGIEPPELDIMERQPRDPKSGVLGPLSIMVIIYQAFVMGCLSLGAYLWQCSLDGSSKNCAPHSQSLTYTLLTTMQLLQAFLTRSTETSVFRMGLFGNRWMVAGVLFSFSCLLIAVYVPPINTFFTLVPLGSEGGSHAYDWLLIVVCCLIQVVLSELLKCVIRWWRQRSKNQREILPSTSTTEIPLNDRRCAHDS